jgi:hypothetical protein
MIRLPFIVRCLAWSGALLVATGGVAAAKVTTGSIMVPSIQVRETPSRDSAIVMTLQRGTPVLLSTVPRPTPGWLHVMYEDASAELRHGYVPLGTVGIMTLRTSTDAFAAAHDGAAFPDLGVQAELGELKCKRVPRSLGRLESCVVRYAVRLTAPHGFSGSALAKCTSTVDFLTGDGERATVSDQEQITVISTQSRAIEGSVEVAAPLGGSYDQAAISAIECRLEKVTTF